MSSKKNWIITVRICIKNKHQDEVKAYMEEVKPVFAKKTFDEFFEADTLCFYMPTLEETNVEIREFILNDR